MDLAVVWFILIAVLWIGYFFLEGFDFGVGMLMPIVGKTSKERRVAINTIGPVWDGNEVWLLTAGGAMFAAFPEWYATLFSGFYLPLFLILVFLIVRGISIEFRSKINTENWRKWCDIGMIVGSWGPAVLWGVAFANLVRGVQLDSEHQYVGGFFALLNPYALLGGATTAILFALHGAVFIALKTGGKVHQRAHSLAKQIAPVAIIVAGGFAVWTQLAYGKPLTWIVTALAAAGLVLVVLVLRGQRDGWAFIFSGVTILSAVTLLFGSLFPNVMPSTIDSAYSLTVYNASSTPYTLQIMTWAALVFVPIIIGYQAWSFWVFSRRLKVDKMPEYDDIRFDNAPDALEVHARAGREGQQR